MRKRRVLAVLLALSLVVSGNGMTVLAAESGMEQSAVTTQEETAAPETGEKAGETGTPETGEKPEETGTPEAGEKAGETGTPETDEKPEETGTPETGEKPEESGNTEGSETPGTTQEPGGDETPGAAENPEEPENQDASAGDEATDPVIEQPAEDKKPETVETPIENVTSNSHYVSRIVTFTDDTGMQVTYDANASTQYHYVVKDGVLTAVVTRSEVDDSVSDNTVSGNTVSGNTIETPVAFEGNVELRQPEEGEQYTSIAAGVFSGNQKITYVKLPAGVETIGAEAFKGCTALKGVYLPASVNKIENSAFENCTAMTQINIPKAVTTIGDSAFKGDIKLYLVYMKDVDYSELRNIGKEAFSGCAMLSQFCSHSDFVFPTKLETIGEAAFRDCKAVGKVDFSANKNLTAIGAYVFSGCTSLTDLTPGKTLSEISEGAFSGCSGLVCINFENGKFMGIGKAAFQGCYNLKQLVLPQSIIKIGEYAFQGCTKLKQVEIKCYNIEIAPKAFPADAADLVIVAEKDSNGYNYALENKFRVPDEDAFYRYTVEDVNGALAAEDKDGKGNVIKGKYIFAGGTIWVGTETQNKAEENVNTQNKGEGVKYGEVCYIYYSQTDAQKNTHTFITESLRCNGKAMQKKEGKYYFEMPAGGAVITAEFRANTPGTIKGQKVTVEFSNGTPLQNGLTDEYGYRGVELKVGQTSRMFLLDEDGNPIPAAQLSAVRSDNEQVVKIDRKGVITAVGTAGGDRASATVTVEVKGGDGNTITINRTVSVVTAEASYIILKASDYNSLVKVAGDADGVQTASIKKNIVRAEDLKFKLKANVYDNEEGISRELVWTTSNAKVAVLKADKTTADNPVNEVTVLKGCEGEATITVTATNPADSAKEKITQKFVVRVYEEGFRLTSSAVTVNPRMEEGAAIDLISAYGIGLEDARIALYEEKTLGTTAFWVSYDADGSSDTSRRFRIRPVDATIVNGTYNVRVGVNGDTSEKNLIPLTITVKSSAPNPTVKFNANKAKFNLFYRNGGTTAEGQAVSVITEITKLNGAAVSRVELEPLTQKADDKLFTENFVIDSDNTDLAKGKVAIKRSAGALRYTTGKKAAVKGYLVIYYAGYDDSAAKKMPVTMPTCTTAPSWALRTAKGVYRTNANVQDLSLVLFDKKSKTKEQVVLNETYTVTAEEVGDVAIIGYPQIADGAIKVQFLPDKGSMKLVLHNDAWDLDQNGRERTLKYTYSVNVSAAKPVIKTDQNAVTLNLNYPEKTAQFQLVSNLGGIEIEKAQTFTPVVTNANAGQIENLWVTYENGVGTVGIQSGKTVSKGTYKFECYPRADESDLKKVVLTIKVVDAKPDVKFGKGSLQLNTVVYENNNRTNGSLTNDSQSDDRDDVPVNGTAQQPVVYREVSEQTFKVNGRPDGYTLASVGSGEDKTEIVCTSNYGAGKYFEFEVIEDPTQEKEDILKVSLKDRGLMKGTYKFRMTARYLKAGMTTVSAKPVNFQVKVISETDIYMAVSQKGKINLVNREGEANAKNGIVYTPALKNIVGEIEDAKIYDANTLEEESKFFDICLIREGKDAGKLFVTPKKTVKAQNPDGSTEYTYAELDNNKNYAVRIWVQVNGYAGNSRNKGGVLSKTIRIKTGQTLPKVTTDKTSLDVFLSTKNYNASFVVKPKEGSVGAVGEIYFDEKDDLAKDSFELIQTPQADGSMKVTVHLKEAVGFANGTVNNVKFYVKYKGQGTNTSEKATGFTMKIKVN